MRLLILISLVLLSSCSKDETLDFLPELYNAPYCAADQSFSRSARSAVFTSTKSGPWNDVKTWGGSSIPTANDDVYIKHSVNIQPSTIAYAKNVYVEKSLNTEFGSVLNVSKDLVIDGGSSNPKGTVKVGGNYIMNGGKVRFNQEGNPIGAELIVDGDMILNDDADFKNYTGECGRVHIKGKVKITNKKVKVGGDTDILAEGGLENDVGAQIKNVYVVQSCKLLSLSFLSFSAEYDSEKKSVKFYWTTAEEVGEISFVVQHASNCDIKSNKFSNLDSTFREGKNGSKNEYEVEFDLDPENENLYHKGFHYFRVKINDEGKTIYSDLEAVKFQ